MQRGLEQQPGDEPHRPFAGASAWRRIACSLAMAGEGWWCGGFAFLLVGKKCLSGGRGPASFSALRQTQPKKATHAGPAAQVHLRCLGRGACRKLTALLRSTFKTNAASQEHEAGVSQNFPPARPALRHGQKGGGAYRRCARPSRKPMPAPRRATRRTPPNRAQRWPEGIEAPVAAPGAGCFPGGVPGHTRCVN